MFAAVCVGLSADHSLVESALDHKNSPNHPMVKSSTLGHS